MISCSLQKLRISSFIKARFVAITKLRFLLPALLFAATTIYFINGKLSRGSPPWNSILIFLDGERRAKSIDLSATSVDISNLTLSSDCLDTWQYGQLCSHRRDTTKM